MDDANAATALGDALVSSGLPLVEITLRTPNALAVIEALVDRGDLLVGAGTVTTLAQFDAVRRLGVRFISSPGLDDAIVRHALRRDLLVIPGAVTPTEVLRAQNMGLNLVKFFPASVFGGVAALEAISAPFPEMKFLPTGGLSQEDVPAYLRLPCVPACGGSWMVRPEWLKKGDWAKVSAACKKAAGTAPRIAA